MNTNKEIEFLEGFWVPIQELVINHDLPSIALDIIRKSGYECKECFEVQVRSGYENDRMMKFIQTLK